MKVIDLATHTAGLTYGFNMRTAVDAAYRKIEIGESQYARRTNAFVDDLSKLALDFRRATIGIIPCRSTCWAIS